MFDDVRNRSTLIISIVTIVIVIDGNSITAKMVKATAIVAITRVPATIKSNIIDCCH